MIGRSLAHASKLLVVPAYLSLSVWIQTSCLFMWLENFWGERGEFSTKDSMNSLPETMYWCCIFLTGEWANVDFTFAGSRMCIFYVIFGIALFSIPVGIIVESVKNTIEMTAQEEMDVVNMDSQIKKSKAEPEDQTLAE